MCVCVCVCVCRYVKGIPPPHTHTHLSHTPTGIAQLAERQTAGKARCNTVAGTTPRCGGMGFSPRSTFLYRLSLSLTRSS